MVEASKEHSESAQEHAQVRGSIEEVKETASVQAPAQKRTTYSQPEALWRQQPWKWIEDCEATHILSLPFARADPNTTTVDWSYCLHLSMDVVWRKEPERGKVVESVRAGFTVVLRQGIIHLLLTAVQRMAVRAFHMNNRALVSPPKIAGKRRLDIDPPARHHASKWDLPFEAVSLSACEHFNSNAAAVA